MSNQSRRTKTRSKAPSKPRTRTQRAPNRDKMELKLQELLDKYNRAYDLVQKKMAECEKDLKLLDDYMKRELKAKEAYDAYEVRYRAMKEGAGTKM